MSRHCQQRYKILEGVAFSIGKTATHRVSPLPLARHLHGVVEVVTKLLRACSAATAERCLRMLVVLAMCAEGRAAMAEEWWCAAAVVERITKASKAAVADAVAVLWSLCCLCRNVKVRDDVAKRNGVVVVLLVMQRGWEEHVRSMCVDLIKVLKGARKNGLGLELGCYDTKTTHIKPC